MSLSTSVNISTNIMFHHYQSHQHVRIITIYTIMHETALIIIIIMCASLPSSSIITDHIIIIIIIDHHHHPKAILLKDMTVHYLFLPRSFL